MSFSSCIGPILTADVFKNLLKRRYRNRHFSLLWPPCVADADIIIFAPWFLLSSFYLFVFPRLISAVADWMSAILPHIVWPTSSCATCSVTISRIFASGSLVRHSRIHALHFKHPVKTSSIVHSFGFYHFYSVQRSTTVTDDFTSLSVCYNGSYLC